MKVLHVVGARPNFMKTAPLMRQMSQRPETFQQVLIHTGQHYDYQMSELFFQDLGLPKPDVHLGVGSASHALQTARVMEQFEPVLMKHRPDWVVVVGDVNSTLACALTAAKMSIRVGHVEAGLRSFDRTMPEEMNRVLTDQLSDVLFTPSLDGNANLCREGVPPERVHFVGNVMIDTLVAKLPEAESRWPPLRDSLGLEESTRFVLVTLHRPSNVDDPAALAVLMDTLKQMSTLAPVIFPVHPRTRQRLTSASLGSSLESAKGVKLIEPLGYLDFLALERHSALVVTDSGGIQEETTYLGVPCLTVRPNTERPVTITHGTNRLIERDAGAIVSCARAILLQPSQRLSGQRVPELWDGHAAERIVKVFMDMEGHEPVGAHTEGN